MTLPEKAGVDEPNMSRSPNETSATKNRELERFRSLVHRNCERALTGFYPCLPSGPESEAILRELAWGEHGSPGPSVANSACRSLKFTSMRDGEVGSQSDSYGAPSGPAVMLGSTETPGAAIDFKSAAPINHAAVATLVEALRSLIERLSIVLRVS